jgi:hypothetical protein
LRIRTTGSEEVPAANAADLAKRFDKSQRHKSWKTKGAAPVKGGELKSKQQVRGCGQGRGVRRRLDAGRSTKCCRCAAAGAERRAAAAAAAARRCARTGR